MTSALSADQRTVLERFVQKTRRGIEDDLAGALEGRFGIHLDGAIEEAGALTLSNALAAIRSELIEIVEYLRMEGEGASGSVERLVREAAFTHTNRLIAVRIAEAIGLLPETMAKGVASSGFRDFSELAPIVAGTDWGRFAIFLRICGDELAADIPSLFDPRNPLLDLAMSEAVLSQVVEQAQAIPSEVWAAPDALGWAYQFFNTGDERKEMREAGAPRNSRELAVRNQFFTPSYVVEFLVQNGLGAHLAAGFPELVEDLSLLVDHPRDVVDVDLSQVSVLDPACGSGHFLLGAYDVLERAWRLAGVEPDESAPDIVRSLWGIDIDPRATQIAQAAVMFRARRHRRDRWLPTANVICARALPPGPSIDRLLSALPDHVARAVSGVAQELAQAPVLGPLLRVEQRLSREVRDIFGTGVVEGSLADGADEDGSVRSAVLTALSEIADSTTSSAVERLFIAEAHDAVRFIEAMSKRYTAVLMNPPFGQACESSDEYLKAAYPDSWTELYACFVERGLELSIGSVGAITSSTFLAAKRLGGLRTRLAQRGMSALIDLGAGVLHGATVNTATFVVRRSTVTRYLDVSGAADKDSAVRAAVSAGLGGHDLRRFSRLPNQPFAFHVSEPALQLWDAGSTLEPTVATVRTGGKTFDNFRYVRLWWELPQDSVERGWRWYEKGGEYQPFVSPTRLLINWKGDGAELREYGARAGRTAQVLQSSKHWGRPGICFPRMSSIGFSARTMPAGEIFADTSIAVLPISESSALPLLGYLNSTVVAEILSIFGRGRSTENASVKSLPLDRSWMWDEKLAALTSALIEIFAQVEASIEISPLCRILDRAPDEQLVAGLVDEVERLQRDLDAHVIDLLGLADRLDATIPLRPGLNASTIRSLIPPDGTPRSVSVAVGHAFGRWIQDPPEAAGGERNWFAAAGMPSHVMSADQVVPYLIDAPGHPLDVAQRVQKAVTQLDPGNETGFEDLGAVRRHLRNRFFAQHLLDYSASARSAPIYWPLQIPSKAWAVWLYAPGLSREALFAVVREAEQRHRLAVDQIAHLQREAASGGGGRSATALAKELEGEQRLAVELVAFRDEAERIANLGWEPDLDDGMVLNAAPLADLFPAWKDAAAYRKELRQGKYEWATVARFADRL